MKKGVINIPEDTRIQLLSKKRDEYMLQKYLNEELGIVKKAWFYGLKHAEVRMCGYLAWVRENEFCFVSSVVYDEYIFQTDEYSFCYSWNERCWYIQRKLPKEHNRLNSKLRNLNRGS